MTATTITTIPALTVETAALETVTFDFYRDIHKGIRNELFARDVRRRHASTPADAEAVGGGGDPVAEPRPACS